ncbi:MAG: hypothetical protein M0D57_03050 [Sphingobacteriales bacterium JAD_PAG50586_3]|nr:MAG: hypothetical protein M0D57_03050 [Sphingobacteriales bacterium JAD_PAG50586_3]
MAETNTPTQLNIKFQAHKPYKTPSPVKRESVMWDQIVSNTTIYPEYTAKVRDNIQIIVGYRFPEAILQKYESYARVLFANVRQGLITVDDYYSDLKEHVRLMRNIEMREFGWVRTETYSDKSWQRYETENTAFKHKARQRLCNFLNYEPDPKFSLEAELLMRQLYLLDRFHEGKITEIDAFGMTVTQFRELYFTQGEKEADKLLLYCEKLA